jgi:hypothetical protein
VDIDAQISSLDPALFDAVPSQTCPEDRRSLLLLQRCVRRRGTYVYLEIGSYLGGTLQPHLVDPRCNLIYSIDKRPTAQPDKLRGVWHYPENSSRRMLIGLEAAYPESSRQKIHTFDADARDVDPALLPQKPALCFIDAEHTDNAVRSDFGFCLRVCNPDGVIAFHDANIVFGGLARIKRSLNVRRIRFRGFLLPGSVYVILLNDAIEKFGQEIRQVSADETRYMRQARWDLRRARLALRRARWAALKTRISRRYPALQKVWHASKRLVRAG